MSAETVKLTYADKTYTFPIVIGTEGEKGVDISALRRETGLVTFDNSFLNTASCYSSITFIDGERGILRYRGYPIEEIAGKYTFIETAYLLLHGDFPTREQRAQFSRKLNENSLIHEDMVHFFDGFPRGAHPMHILSTMINALATFHPNVDLLSMKDDIDSSATRLISIVRTLAAYAYKKSIGEPMVYPRHDLSYCANFLNMMFQSPVRPYEIDQDIVDALNLLLVLHADHEQNCSTTTVRVIGSAQVNLYATISAGISALSGPLHGGANQEVMNMLRLVESGKETVDSLLSRAKDKQDAFLLMGFGHRIYKSYDPRARIIKAMCDKILAKLHVQDPLLTIAREIEAKALADDYFVSKNLYPNVDFYSGIIYRAIGIPENMLTVMFALGRLPGWIAQWNEMVQDKTRKISRPRQIYMGPTLRHCPEPQR